MSEELICPVCGNFGTTSYPGKPSDAFDTTSRTMQGRSLIPLRLVCRSCGVVLDAQYVKTMPEQVDIKCWSAENVRNSYRGALEEGLEEDAAIEYAANKFGLSEKGVRKILRGR